MVQNDKLDEIIARLDRIENLFGDRRYSGEVINKIITDKLVRQSDRILIYLYSLDSHEFSSDTFRTKVSIAKAMETAVQNIHKTIEGLVADGRLTTPQESGIGKPYFITEETAKYVKTVFGL